MIPRLNYIVVLITKGMKVCNYLHFLVAMLRIERKEHQFFINIRMMKSAPLKDELLSTSLVTCNKMVPESTTMNPHISDVMLPMFCPSQSYMM